MSKGMKLLLTDSRGIYIPRDFVEEFDLTKFDGIKLSDLAALHDPNDQWYWEAWDNVLLFANHTDEHGHKWYLHQDGDLWMFCPELMTDDEYLNFFGEARE